MKPLSNTATAALFSVVITCGVGVALKLPFGAGLEAWMSDKLQTWRYELLEKLAPRDKPDPHLVLVGIDQQSLTDLGSWPLPRAIHGQFLQLLAAQQPRVVGWDVFFTEKSGGADAAQTPAGGPAPDLGPNDAALVQGAQSIPRLVTAASNEAGGTSLQNVDTGPTQPLKNVRGDLGRMPLYQVAALPFPELRQVSHFGFADADAEDQRRIMPLVVNTEGRLFPTLGLEMLMLYWDVKPDQVVVDLGHAVTLPRPDGSRAEIPIDDQGRLLVNYRARAEDFPSMSYSRMGAGLHDLETGQTSAEQRALPDVRDKIVMVGVTVSGVDSGAIPIDPYSPLVVAHLNVLNNILQNDYLHAVDFWVWMPVYLVFLFAVASAMLRVGISPMIPIGLGAVLAGFVATFATLWFANLLVPLLIPETGVLILAGAVPTKRFFGEEREKMRIKGAMSAYLSDKVMNKVLEHPDNLKLGGSKHEITIMFCDIRGFTAYCDNRDPGETVHVLNEYMEIMTQVVFKYDGTIDKYIGDCIMAFWNAPEPQADHAERAVRCAMDMRHALALFKSQRVGLDTELFECGIGIHTGEALVGNMGSSLKRNYTAMGSTVNLGARLESHTKKLKEHILISKATRDLLPEGLPLTDRGLADIPGFAEPVHVFAVVTEQEIAAALEVGRALAGNPT
jgi:adenylate cyclase